MDGGFSGYCWFYCAFLGFSTDLDSFGFSDIVSPLTVQILNGFQSIHNLIDKWPGFFDFWNFKRQISR